MSTMPPETTLNGILYILGVGRGVGVCGKIAFCL